MEFKEITLSTSKTEEIIDITSKVSNFISEAGVVNGVCFVYVPHSTAAVIINENVDPNLRKDILNNLSRLVPEGIWEHDKLDSNATAHLKSALLSPSISIPIRSAELVLGTWQSLAFVELDGPRKRSVFVTILKGD